MTALFLNLHSMVELTNEALCQLAQANRNSRSDPQAGAPTLEQRRKFPPICPDFVVELRSATDDLKDLQAKMQEYLANGIRLGWLIDPGDPQAVTPKVEVYRPDKDLKILQSPTSLSGEEVLPGFILDLRQIF